jgi:hypothetical protein
MDNFSYLAVLVGGIAFFGLGALWYSVVFQKPWAAGMGIDITAAPSRPSTTPLVGAFLVGLVVAYIVEFFVRDQDLGFGLCRGALVGIAMAAVIVQNGLFDPRPRIVTLINAGFPLVGGLIVGAIASAI